MIKDIKDYLVSEGVTTSIYLSHMPDSPDECVCLYQYAGQSELNTAQLERPGLQIKSRADDYVSAMANLKEITDIIRMIGDELNGNVGYIEVNGTKYFRAIPVSAAFSDGLDENDRMEVKQNFYITKEY